VGIAGGVIAKNQAATARAKLKLDLFEKRYPIFEETWRIMSEVALKARKRGATGSAIRSRTSCRARDSCSARR